MELKQGQYNVIVKPVAGREYEYRYRDMIATKLSKPQFEKVQAANPKILDGYKFIPYHDTDFSWWMRIEKYLTKKYIRAAAFDVDACGYVTKY